MGVFPKMMSEWSFSRKRPTFEFADSKPRTSPCFSSFSQLFWLAEKICQTWRGRCFLLRAPSCLLSLSRIGKRLLTVQCLFLLRLYLRKLKIVFRQHSFHQVSRKAVYGKRNRKSQRYD